MSALPLDSQHQDYQSVRPIVEAIYEAAGGGDAFAVQLPLIIRTAVDEVIDAPRTGRFLLEEAEKTEKTYLGTKVEILLRAYLGFSKGATLDMNVKGAEVDIKNTMANNWSIPRENVGRPALLVRSSERRSRLDVGVAILHDEYLNRGANQDQKRSTAAASQSNIWWMLKDHPYPVNFWQLLTLEQRQSLNDAGSGTARIAALFELVQKRAISRIQVQALARQHDYMKRIRRNGGARDLLAPKGIAILSGKYDQTAIQHLNLGLVTSEEFISFRAEDEVNQNYLRDLHHID